MSWAYKRRIGLEAIVADTIERGPKEALKRIATALHRTTIRLYLNEAEELSRQLREKGLSIQPYDFPRTFNVWESENESGVPYTQIAMKEFVQAVAAKEQANYITVEGFRQILPHFNANALRKTPINQHGTTLGTILKYGIAELVISLVNNELELTLPNPKGWGFFG